MQLTKQTFYIGTIPDPDVGLGLGSDYPDMSMTAIPGATTPDDIQLESWSCAFFG